MITPFATRAHNHNLRELDPIVRSLLDLDWYKISQPQFILKYFPDVKVKFALINRKKSVRLAEIIDEGELRRQLDHARTLRFKKSELIWLAGNTFYGVKGILEPWFLKWLEAFSLPDYVLEKQDGQYILTFEGDWASVSMWEICALSIINELRTRTGLSALSEFELDILYARAKTKLWGKIERLRGVPGLKISDFGTRRRHSFLWQEYVIQAMKSELPGIFGGTSNAYLAYKHDLEAIGTNAHELPMTLAALARAGRLGDVTVRQSQYEVLRLWHEMYGEAMQIVLPDTFGSTQFFAGAPEWVARLYKGVRPDSKDAYAAGDEVIGFFAGRGQDPRDKLLIPSDGLDVDAILGLHAYFSGRVKEGIDARTDFRSAADFLDPAKWAHEPRIKVSMGWGTLLTNDFRGCHPRGQADFDPISLVCKVAEVDGAPAVKLSDNYLKGTGTPSEIAYYRDVFGTDGMENVPVTV